jgi:hypothetical protein
VDVSGWVHTDTHVLALALDPLVLIVELLQVFFDVATDTETH